MAAPVIETRELGKVYPGGGRALGGVSLRFEPGEMVAIIGSSGAGKSTLLRCLNRLLEPTEGRVLLHGEDVSFAAGRRLRRVRRRIGMIFQQFNLVSRLTVLENVLIGSLHLRAGTVWGALAHARRFSGPDRERALGLLAEVGIAEFAHRRAEELSGGQQQRVAIARVLAQSPDIVLADEPVASLDPTSATLVMDHLRRLNAEYGKTVLVNLHHLDLARKYADRVIGMRGGRVVCDLRTTELSDQRTAEVYGSSDAAA